MDKYKTLTNVGGYAIVEQHGRLIFINYGTSWLYTFNFVFIILFIISFANGIIQLIINNLLAGIILSLIGILLAFLLILGIWLLKKSKNKSLDKISIICIVDLMSKELLNKNGQLIAPLHTVRFSRAMQLFSSSYAIQAEWPGGSIIILRGNPFAGGTAHFISTLKKKGLMK